MARIPKRKAAEQSPDDTYDSDEIQLLSPPSSRGPLRSVSVEQTQNKRRRVADCVLIPVSRDIKKLNDDVYFGSSSPRRYSTSSGHESIQYENEGQADRDDLRAEPPSLEVEDEQEELPGLTDRSRSTQSDEILPTSYPSSDAGRSRPRRAAQRKSYTEFVSLDDDSADELTMPAPAPAKARGKRAKREPSVESDFAEDAASAAESEQSDEVEPDKSDSEHSIDEESDEDVRKGRKRKTATARRPAAAAAGPSVVAASSSTQAAPTSAPSRTMSKEMKKLTSISKGLDANLPPLHNNDDIFADLTKRALGLGFNEAVKSLEGRKLKVATMCSGTESPLLAMEMIRDSLKSEGSSLDVEHLFSAEIVPFKQAYIERNFSPPIIFRDITELVGVADHKEPVATTAYGAKVPVPTDIDMVIAGTSCVDFSSMNKYRKEITDGGESGDTWSAVLAFCKAFRPTMVILENVMTAPWDRMLQDYKDVGYEPAGAYVDSKNFYIPQTRQRGYMVCFDSKRLEKAGVTTAAKTWRSSMEKLQRRASSAVSSFLLPSHKITQRQLQVNENARDVDWSRCEVVVMNYRETKRLGLARPATHWSESGSMLPPDHSSRAWHGAQVERVLDVLDASLLRKALEGYDARFKTRVWDVSQNIHRGEDKTFFGLIGCITPSGINFVSDSWRAMTPEECLILQGIPLKKISFTVETNGDVQDLAGNAMSCPLVGAAILSGLIAGHKIFTTAAPTTLETPSQETIHVQNVPELLPCDTVPFTVDSGSGQFDISTLFEGVEAASRRCYCEGTLGMTERPIQLCASCGHTTCTTCGGNPEHNYRHSLAVNAGRKSFSDFEEGLRSKLPLQLQLLPAPELQGPKDYVDTVQKLAKAVFSLSSVRRTHCIRVTYTASYGRLKLCLYDNKAEWRLYAEAPAHLPTNAALREALSQPVATSHVAQSLLGDRWQWRMPAEKTARADVTGSGDKLPTWWARMQMPDYRDHWQWQYLTIKVAEVDVSGKYEYLPNCGTACESLYKRVSPEETNPLYLFLDPTRVGPASEDCFVFARDHALLEYHERRHVVAHVDAGWRAWELEGNRQRVSIKYHDWTDAHEARALEPGKTNALMHRPVDVSEAAHHSNCHQAVTAFRTELDLASLTRRPLPEIVPLDDDQFFADAAWVFEAARRQLPMNKWLPFHSDASTGACDDCAPLKPSLRWKLRKDGTIEPYEDYRSAATYERAMKARRSPLIIEAQPTSLTVGLNLATLAHRARSRLEKTESKVEFSWRLSASHADRAIVKRFKLSETKGVQPFNGDLRMPTKPTKMGLFHTQKLVLTWMREQEAGRGQPIMLEEAEEASIPSLGWRAEMRAQTLQYVKGGVCADHPGFGKTITSLSLIQSEWLSLGSDGICDSLRDTQESKAGFLASSATVVVCPRILVPQWTAEARKIWQSADDICEIKTLAELGKYSLDKFQSAKLIVVNRQILASDAYTEALAAFAAMPGPATDRGRAHAEWHREASKELPEHLRILKQSGKTALGAQLKTKYLRNVSRKDLDSYAPSQRLKGQAYADAKLQKGKTQAKTMKHAAAELNTKLLGVPLFEMFFFNRMVVDEFHEGDAKEFAVTTALKADKRWGLSGTPALGDCFDVAQLGKLLNVPLPIGSIARGVMKQRNMKALHLQMTSFEKFDAARTAPSNSQNGRIYELAQTFLDTFVRRNLMDGLDIKVHQHLVPVALGLSHAATYHELSQHLNSLDMRIRKSTKTDKTHRDQELSDAVGNSDSAEEALSKAAAFPRRLQSNAFSAQPTVDDWSRKREDEAAELVRDLAPVLAQACAKEPEEYATLKLRIDTDILGDQETCATVRGLCRQAETSSTNKIAARSGDQSSTRELTSQANRMVNRLLVSRRSSRYLKNVKKMQLLKIGKDGRPRKCNEPDCGSELQSSDAIAVSGLCGHLVCADCFQRMQAKNKKACQAVGCNAAQDSHHLLWNHTLNNIRGTRHSHHGAKIEAALTILESIRKQGDQAVLFVQYSNQLTEVEQALKERGIKSIVVHKRDEADAQVDAFKDPDDRSNVALVLNASDETAAGLNLQNANHVIFLSPLLRDTQYAYDATMAQAVGRVRRPGQEKEVHVYRIVALNTIDTDILEHRERRVDALTEQGAPAISPPPVAKMLDMHAADPKPERMQLVREDGMFSLRPQSWLVKCGADENEEAVQKVKGRSRVGGWEDFSSLVKFSKAFTEDDD